MSARRASWLLVRRTDVQVASVALLLLVPILYAGPYAFWIYVFAPMSLCVLWRIYFAPMMLGMLLATHELRVPGVSRAFVTTVAGLVVWIFALMCVPLLARHDVPAWWPQLALMAVCLGALSALVGSLLQQVLWLALYSVIGGVWVHWPWALTHAQLTILSAAMLLILAGRSVVVGRQLRRGSKPAISLFGESESDAGAGSRRAHRVRERWRGARSPGSVVRAVLGPPYERRALLKEVAPFLCLVIVLNVPAAIFFGDQPWSSYMVLAYILMLVPMVAGAWCLGLATRLSALLTEQGAERVELVLLPGAGNAREQGRVLLKETIVRPLSWGAPFIAGMLVAYAAMLWRIHAPAVALVSGVLLVLCMVLLFATIIVGVVARKLSVTRHWMLVMGVWAYLFFVPGTLTLQDLVRSHGSPSLGQLLAWLLLLALLSAALMAWGWQARRFERLLYP